MPFAPSHHRIRIIAILAASAYASAHAQQASTLHGTVRDPLGARVDNATVELLDASGVVDTTKTNAIGAYSFSPTAIGRYSVRVTAPTFQATTSQAEYLKPSAAIEVNVTLATATLTQQVTVTATGTPTPEAQIGAAVTVLPAESYQFELEVQDPLRLVPGAQVTQVGQVGGTTGLNIRGASTDANKVLIDGVPANSIGGAVEFANIASVGIGSIEVLREPNSALYGSDALAGVVNMTTPRGGTPLPYMTYAGDAGNFRGYNNQVTAGATFHQFDLYSAFARFNTDNNIPNSEFHNATYAGNFGWTPNAANDLRFTVRHIVVSGGQPNAIGLYGIADDGREQERDDYYNAAWNSQTTPRWHNQIRYGGLRQNGLFTEFGATGIPDPNSPGYFDGAPVTLTGANGYTVSGQAQFQYSSSLSTSGSTTNRDFVSAQTDYQLTPRFFVLGGFKYENESGTSVSADDGYNTAYAIQRGNYSYTVQLAGDLRNRLFYTLGTGLEDNGLYGFAGTPRASLAYYLARPGGSGLFSGTKLHGTFGKGIKEPSVYEQNNSLLNLLSPLPGSPGVPSGEQVIGQFNITQLGAENSRTFDGGLDQQLFGGRFRAGITYFHDEFTNAVEYVPAQGILDLFGIASTSPAASPIESTYGGYINSLAFRSQGVEVESEIKLARNLFTRAGYTYTDAVVQHSFSSDNIGPSYNTAFTFGNIPIGAYSPLVGARPFRIAPHTGYFDLDYTPHRFYASLSATLVGRRDDSTFLCDNTIPYGCGTSLLLPNRNLDGAYRRLDLGAGYQVTPRMQIYANIKNLLSEHYDEAFGYPALPFTFRSGIKFNFGGESWKLN
jgi:iron complex outermembrane receptor protein/vitamin B12 transporter